jgi:anaerobic selenocysteine-containing dehydrogenase
MGQKDLEMLGESAIKNPETWAAISGIPVDELKELITECEKRNPKTQEEFESIRESIGIR